MKKKLKPIVERIANILGQHLCPLTGKDDLLEFFRGLHPKEFPNGLIRLGGSGDGGYLVPDDLAGIGFCFSPGVGKISTFELECANRGMQVFLADASVDGPAAAHANFNFIKKFIGAGNDGDTISLGDWMDISEVSMDDDFMLQMDIEGSEYVSILACSSELLSRFRIIVLELHQLQHMWARPFFDLASEAVAKILLNHVCVHIHPNNIGGSSTIHGLETLHTAEFTFVRKDRLPKDSPYASRFPHPLDEECTNASPISLPSWWIGS